MTRAARGLAGAGSKIELARLNAVRRELPAARRYDDLAGALRRRLAAGDDAEAAAAAAGEALWRRAAGDARDGAADDRPLYWARLGMQAALRSAGAQAHAGVLEAASRGFDMIADEDPLLVLTGFDPFHLDREPGQSNPSGAAALGLHGSTIGGLRVTAAILPVRYRDFDAGVVESLFSDRLARGGVALAVTVSMGREAFDLERFPGRRRSVATLDNEGRAGGGSPEQPFVPPGLAGPEFVEFSLPASAMAAVAGDWAVRDNRRVRTAAGGRVEAASIGELEGQVAVEGSGGGFLSNEVAYRSLLVARDRGYRGRLGHLHTPTMRGYDAAALAAMVEQIRAILLAGAEAARD